MIWMGVGRPEDWDALVNRFPVENLLRRQTNRDLKQQLPIASPDLLEKANI